MVAESGAPGRCAEAGLTTTRSKATAAIVKRMRISFVWKDRAASAFNLVHLAPTRFDQVVIVLHNVLHFLHRLAALPPTLHHLLEFIHALHFHFRHKHPVPLGAEVRHDSHLRHATLGSDSVHRQELLNHRPDFARLAKHDLANEEHGGLPRGICIGRGGRLGPPNGSRLSCGALKKDSFLNLRAPSASSAWYAADAPI